MNHINYKTNKNRCKKQKQEHTNIRGLSNHPYVLEDPHKIIILENTEYKIFLSQKNILQSSSKTLKIHTIFYLKGYNRDVENTFAETPNVFFGTIQITRSGLPARGSAPPLHPGQSIEGRQHSQVIAFSRGPTSLSTIYF